MNIVKKPQIWNIAIIRIIVFALFVPLKSWYLKKGIIWPNLTPEWPLNGQTYELENEEVKIKLL